MSSESDDICEVEDASFVSLAGASVDSEWMRTMEAAGSTKSASFTGPASDTLEIVGALTVDAPLWCAPLPLRL